MGVANLKLCARDVAGLCRCRLSEITDHALSLMDLTPELTPLAIVSVVLRVESLELQKLVG
jgi:hypothetical protein